MKRNQKGFGVVEGLLILVIVGLIGFIGWYVYGALKNTNNAYNTATKTSLSSSPKFSTKAAKNKTATIAKTPKTTDITANWTALKSPDGSFTFKAPGSWVSLTCDKSGGSTSSVFIASNQSHLAVCQSDNTGEADLTMRPDNSAASAPQKQSMDQSFSTESFTVNGVKGYKATEMTTADDVFLPNAKIITYSFYSGGKSFYGSYRQPSGGQDDSAAFEQIVQTWKF